MKHFSQEEKEKQWTESRKSRVERDFFLHNLENREEKENCFKNLTNREEKEDCCLKILKIEKWKRNENTILQLEREKYESFLLEIFSRSRLLSMTAPPNLRNRLRPWKRPSQGPKNDWNDPEKKILALTHIDNPFFAKNGVQFGIFWPQQVPF